MSKCSCANCDLEVFDDNSDKCILHCEKDDWITKHDLSSDEFDLGTEVIYFWDEEKVKKFWKKFKEVIEEKKIYLKKTLIIDFMGLFFLKWNKIHLKIILLIVI